MNVLKKYDSDPLFPPSETSNLRPLNGFQMLREARGPFSAKMNSKTVKSKLINIYLLNNDITKLVPAVDTEAFLDSSSCPINKIMRVKKLLNKQCSYLS